MKVYIKDSLHALRVGLPNLPRLHIGDVLVAKATETHCVVESLAETVEFYALLGVSLDLGDFGEGFLVVIRKRGRLRNNVAKILFSQEQRAVNEVAKHSHKFVVVALLEILPSEIVVLGFGGVGGEHITENILLAGELLVVFVQPYSPVPRRGNLVAFEVKELVGGHIVGQYVRTLSLQYRREHNAVEHDVVLADEVDEFGLGVFPIFLPIGRKLLGERYIANRRVKPNIKHFAFCALHGYGDAPIKVAAHGSRLQSLVEPTLALSIDIDFPILVVLENPFFEELLIIVQRHIPMRGLFQDGLAAGDCRFRLNEFGGVERRAALLALVTVCVGIAAMRTRAGNVAVGEELLCLFVVILFGGLLHKLAIVVEFLENLLRSLGVYVARCARVDVETDSEILKCLFVEGVVLVDDVLGCNAVLASLHHNGDTVFVGTTDVDYIAVAEPLIPHINIRRDIHTRHMANMDGAVGIR